MRFSQTLTGRVSQQLPHSLQARHHIRRTTSTKRSNTANRKVHKEMSGHPHKRPATNFSKSKQTDAPLLTFATACVVERVTVTGIGRMRMKMKTRTR